jgi:hypothetical protein
MHPRDVSGRRADRLFGGSVLVWSTCALLTIGGYQVLLSHGRSPLNLVFILLLLGAIAGTYRIRTSIGALSLLIVGMLFAWPLSISWLLSVVPSDLARAGGDLRWIGALTVLVIGVIVAIWQRPPVRGPAEATVLETRLVNWISVLLVVSGPVIGWLVFTSFAKGDIYMRPAVIGGAVGIYGLLLFSAYSAISSIISRPRAAAIMAVTYPLLLVLVATLGASLVDSLRQVPSVVVEAVAVDGRLVRASGASPAQVPASALDGREETAWNALRGAPAWIEIDLGEPSTIAGFRLLVAQSPGGDTVHQLIGIDASGREIGLADLRGFTREGQWLSGTLSPAIGNVRSVRVVTLASPSWVSWREIELVVSGS